MSCRLVSVTYLFTFYIMSILSTYNDLLDSVTAMDRIIIGEKKPMDKDGYKLEDFELICKTKPQMDSSYETGKTLQCKVCKTDFAEKTPDKGFSNLWCSSVCARATVSVMCDVCDEEVKGYHRASGKRHAECRRSAEEYEAAERKIWSDLHSSQR